MTIRDARPEDYEAAIALWSAAGLRARPAESTESLERLCARDDAWLLVAEVDGTIAGTVIATYDGWRGHFYRLAVSPEYRRRGIARALVEAGEERLVGVGARRLVSIVVLDNALGVGFWTEAGYPQEVEVGRFLKQL